jgi:hypothetical protein
LHLTALLHTFSARGVDKDGCYGQDEAALDPNFAPPGIASDSTLRPAEELLIVAIIVAILIGLLVLVATR